MTQTDPIKIFTAILMHKQFYFPKRRELLYQYTDMAALCNGILGENREEGKEIKLWASRLAYMNDPSELEVGAVVAKRLYREHFDIDLKYKQKSIDACKGRIFVTSFTPNVDCLPMWNMYGNNGHGIALGFDPKIITKCANVRMFKCLYNTMSSVQALIRKWKENKIDNIDEFLINEFSVDIHDFPLYLLMCLMMLSKDKGYSYENEVRAILTSDDSVKYRYSRGYIIPYKEISLPAQALQKIWIGPAIDQETAYQSVRAYLDYLGFTHVQVESSMIPFRTF